MRAAVLAMWLGTMIAGGGDPRDCGLGLGHTKGAQPPDEQIAGLRSLRVVSAEPEDQGLAKPKQVVRRRVVFENVASTAVELEVVSKTCGCIESSFDAPVVMPGARTTLTVATIVAPASGEQMHTVTFRSSWGNGPGASERGMVAIRYTSDIKYVIRPESAVVTGIAGAMGYVEFFVHDLPTATIPPLVPDARCSLNGWSVSRMPALESAPGLVRFVAQGPMGEVSCSDGEVVWEAEEASAPLFRVPLRLRALTRYRTDPAGIVFVYREADAPGPQVRSVRLIPRIGVVNHPASVVVEGNGEPFSVELSEIDGVHVSFTYKLGLPLIGSSRVRVRAADGTSLAVFPIVWYSAGPEFSVSTD